MKRAINLGLCTAAIALLLSCGGSNSSSSTGSTTSGIKKRAFVSDNFQNQIDIVNAANDTVNTTLTTLPNGTTQTTLLNTINTGAGPAQMVLTKDKTLTLVFDQASNTIAVIVNATESSAGQIPLPDFTESFVVAPDSATVYVAVPNAPLTGQTSGAVEVLNATTGALTNTIPVPRARRVVLSHNGNKLLVFADATDQMWVVDTAAKTATAVTGFDRPVSGVFSSDDSKAYILNCGPECGGTAAKVTVLDMASNTPGASVAGVGGDGGTSRQLREPVRGGNGSGRRQAGRGEREQPDGEQVGRGDQRWHAYPDGDGRQRQAVCRLADVQQYRPGMSFDLRYRGGIGGDLGGGRRRRNRN